MKPQLRTMWVIDKYSFPILSLFSYTIAKSNATLDF